MQKLLVMGIYLSSYTIWTDGMLGDGSKYSNVWVAKVRGGDEVARRVAKNLGYTYKGQVGEFEDYYEMVREDLPKVSIHHSEHFTNNLLDMDEVIWAEQQTLVRPRIYWPAIKEHVKKAGKSMILKFLRKFKNKVEKHCPNIYPCLKVIPTSLAVLLMSLNQGDITKLGTFPTTPAPNTQLEEYSLNQTKPIGLLSPKVSAYALEYNDPLWNYQWDMQDYRTIDMPVMDHNVVPVHNMGYTGKGVTVAVVDNGVDHQCPEYKDNFIASYSYDMCKDTHGSHPVGHPHGTCCAGVIAMKPDNGICGVGIAYGVNIVGIRAICNSIQTKYATSKAWVHKWDKIDIYSNSWGYYGSGKYVFELDHLSEQALIIGTTKGRNGKGSIYVKSSGNDRLKGDNCAADGEVNNIYVIPVAAADQWGNVAHYSEGCTAVFVTAYSDSNFREGIVAPLLEGKCSTGFGGTSAACPQIAAIIALALEANPELTYRDVMHLITMSAEVAPLADNENTWYRNGRGFWVSNDFGFGLLNAENMVILAKTWENVDERRVCTEVFELNFPAMLSFQSNPRIPFQIKACEGTPDEINYLEHIELTAHVNYPFRGHIMAYLTSPADTTSKLIEPRVKDSYSGGLERWTIMSTHNWGENPRGKWKLTFMISYRGKHDEYGHIKLFGLRMHGTKEMPAHYANKREYAAFRLPDGRTSE